jgi:hypothetical protein
VPQTATVAHIGRTFEINARLALEVGAKSETELASFATLSVAILFLAQTVYDASLSVQTIVERRALRTRSLRRRVSQKFSRNRAFVSAESSCDFA